MNEGWEFIEFVLGLGRDPRDLSTAQVCARAALVFIYTVALVRFGDKRFLSRKTAFDAVLGFILASMMARAVNGSGPLLPTMAGGIVIVGMHRVWAYLAMRCHPFSGWIKGSNEAVIREGVVDREALRRNNYSDGDLMENLRLRGVDDPAMVKEAWIERNGDLSVIRR